MTPDPAIPSNREPWSDRVTDLFVLVFGVWTLLVNGVVLGEGGLSVLMSLLPWGGAGLAALLIWWYRPGRPRDPGVPVEERPRDVSGLSRIVLAVVVLGALATMVVTRDVMLGWWAVVLSLLVSWCWIMPNTGTADRPAQSGAWVQTGLWLLALGMAVFAFGFHVADYDDALYVNFAVAAVDNPDLPLLKYDTLHGVPDMPVMFPLYKCTSLEVSGAVLSKAIGWPVMQVFHWVFPALFALLGTLAFARLLRVMVPSCWLWCLVLVMILFVFGGPARKAYEILFWRSQEGKSAYLLMSVPLLLVYGQRFAEQPTLRRWLLLFLAQVGAAGLTANGLWTAPAAAGLGLAAGVPFRPVAFQRIGVGLLASSWVIGLGLVLFLERPSLIAGDSAGDLIALAGQTERGSEFVWNAVTTFFGRQGRLLLGLGTAFLAWTLCPGPRGRRLALTVPLGLLVVLLNPYLATPLAGRVTGLPTYVRVLWSLPTPAYVAVALALPLLLPWRPRRRWFAYLLSAVLVLGYVTQVPRYNLRLTEEPTAEESDKIFRFRWTIEPIRAPSLHYEIARQLCLAVPPKSFVLAPSEISVWVPTIEGYSYPIVCRQYYFQFIRKTLPVEEQGRRLKLRRTISNLPPFDVSLVGLREGIHDYDIKGLVLHRKAEVTPPNLASLLKRIGFEMRHEIGPYQLWVRP